MSDKLQESQEMKSEMISGKPNDTVEAIILEMNDKNSMSRHNMTASLNTQELAEIKKNPFQVKNMFKKVPKVKLDALNESEKVSERTGHNDTPKFIDQNHSISIRYSN